MPSIISTKTSGGGGIAVTGDTSGVLQLQSANGTTAVTIDASQNVGIGTASPSTKLDVNGKVTATGMATTTNTSTTLELNSGTSFNTNGAAIALRGSTTGYNNNGMEFYTGNSERMRIDSTGRAYINGTTGYATPPSGLGIRPMNTDWQLISLVNPNGGAACFINYANPNTVGIAWDAGVGNSTTNWNWRYNGSVIAAINSATGAYSALSDSRVKENIAEYSNALTIINLLRPVTYNFIKDETKKNQIGLIAQEVVDIIPEIVEKPTTEDDYYSLNYAGLAPILVKAIQEQQAIITDLKARIEVLEGASA